MSSEIPKPPDSNPPALAPHGDAEVQPQPAQEKSSDQNKEQDGEPKAEGTFQRTEMTVEGILGFFEKYARTYGLMFLPRKAARSVLLELGDKKRRLPPLMFLSISAFLFAFVIDSFMSPNDISMSPSSVFKSLSQKVSPDTSITGVVFSALPVIAFVVCAGFLISRIWLAGDVKRQKFFAFFCYVFGFYAASVFLLFILVNIAMLMEERRASGSVPVTGLLLIASSVGFLYVIFQPIFALCYGLWRIDADKSKGLRTAKVLMLLMLHPLLVFASGWTETLPHKFNRMISAHNRPEIFYVRSRDETATTVAQPESVEDEVELTFTVAIRNPTDDQLVLNKDDQNSLLAWGNQINPLMGSAAYHNALANHEGLTVVSLAERSSSDDPLIIVDVGKIKWLRCTARMPRSEYDKLTAEEFRVLKLWLPFTALKSKSLQRVSGIVESPIYDFGMPALTPPTPTPTRK